MASVKFYFFFFKKRRRVLKYLGGLKSKQTFFSVFFFFFSSCEDKYFTFVSFWNERQEKFASPERYFYHQLTKLREGNIFSRAFLSVQREGSLYMVVASATLRTFSDMFNLDLAVQGPDSHPDMLKLVQPGSHRPGLPLPAMFKPVQYEWRTVSEWVVGILLKCLRQHIWITKTVQIDRKIKFSHSN